jgi:hypothetical protein
VPLRARTAFVLAVVALLVSMSRLVASSSAKPKPASCLPAGTKLVSDAGLARVFRWYDDGYACRPGVPAVMLGSFYSEDNLSACNVNMAMVRLVPRYVAWREESYCQNAFGWTVHVRRLAKHTKTRMYVTGERPQSDVLIDYGVGPAR